MLDVAPLIGVFVVPEIVYHWYLYDGVPPVIVAVSVSELPIVTDALLSDADTDSAPLTVTGVTTIVLAGELYVYGVVKPLSVTET